MIITNAKERTRFLKFAVVGIIGAIIDIGIFNLVISLVHLNSNISSSISFTLAVCSNFIFNRYWTYPDSRSKKVGRQGLQFIVVSLIGLGIRNLFFWLMEPPLIRWLDAALHAQPFVLHLSSHALSLSSASIGHNTTLIVSIIVVMFWNFFANRFWTYADVE
jgi:putative flippase GtrA